MRFTKAFIIAIAIAFLAVAGAPGRAVADEGWVINSMNTQVDVQRDGTLLITETILVDFDDISAKVPEDSAEEHRYRSGEFKYPIGSKRTIGGRGVHT